ncbi:hypothetical protein, partial [Acinetobacter baumannii]
AQRTLTYNAYVTLMQALGGSPVKELPQ